MPEVLLIDDNLADADLAAEILKAGPLRVYVTVAEDGDQALALLQQAGIHDGARVPDLVLLDLNLPRTSGHEVLQRIRAEPRLSHIPVIVWSSSTAPRDVRRSYELHASCHVEKPMDYAHFVALVENIKAFWLKGSGVGP